MAEHVFEIVSSEILYSGEIFALRRDQVRMPGGKVVARERVENFGAVAIVAMDDDGGEEKFIIGGSTVEIRNVLSRSLGVQFVRRNASFPDGWEPYVGFLAHANDSLPNDWTVEGETAADAATEITIRIFEQASAVEDESPASNREVTPEEGAVLRNLPRLPAGSPIHFDLHVDSEGKATLAAFEPTTNQRIQMGVSLSVMQQAEVDAAKGQVSGMTRRD